MRILFFGDVTARKGREALIQHLPDLKREYSADFTIVNGENAAHGKGITSIIYNELMDAGADVITLGNHALSKKEILKHIEECKWLVWPANMNADTIGQGYVIKTCKGKRIAVINLLGSIFMDEVKEEPIDCMERLLTTIQADLIFVDFHAEATSEKEIF